MYIRYFLILFCGYYSSYSFCLKKSWSSSTFFVMKTKLQMKTQNPTLDENTLWKLSLTFKNPDETKIEVTRANLRVRFVSDRNYEPPQGRLFIEDDYNGLVKTDETGYSGIWTLSEDKNDRKDGLWVWGLFEEPKYPYLYFYLDIYDTIVEKGEEKPIFSNRTIPNGRLNFRFDHYQDKTGVVLLNGSMTYKLTEYVKADPLGLGGNVNVGDDVVAGVVNIAATTSNELIVE